MVLEDKKILKFENPKIRKPQNFFKSIFINLETFLKRFGI